MRVGVALLRAVCPRAVRPNGARDARPLIAAVTAAMLIVVAGAAALPVAAAAKPVKTEISVNTSDGYARLVLRFSEEVEAEARLSNSIVVMSFKQPVELAIDRLSEMAPGYVSAARRDPDGRGLRIALARKVTMNAMMAGEKLFVDLLPDGWTGPPPGLPQDVIEELTRRTREAEKKMRKQQQLARQRQLPLTRVRVGHQPTFSRYIFDLAELVPVAASREKDALTLSFDAPLKFDLADAKASPPPMIDTIETEIRDQTTLVRFAFIGNVDARTFREDHSYVVDVGAVEPVRRGPDRQADAASAARLAEASAPAAASSPRGGGAAAVEPPQTVPVLEATRSPPPPAVVAPNAPVAPNAAVAPVQPAVAPNAAVAPTIAVASAPAAAAGPDRGVAAGPAAPGPTSEEVQPPAPPASANKHAAAAPANERPAVRPAAPPSATPAEAQASPPVAIADLDLPPNYVSPGAAAAKADLTPAPPLDPRNGGVTLARQGDNLILTFAFAAPTPAAAFQRGDALWLVFDTGARIDLAPLNQDSSRTISSARLVPSREGQAARIKLERPRLSTLRADGSNLIVTIGDAVAEPPRPLAVLRNAVVASRATAAVPFDDPRTIHRVVDPEAGDTLFVVTALTPPRGFLRSQDFVEFRALPSSHGVAIQPLADDLQIELSAEQIMLTRPSGLALSSGDAIGRRSGLFRPAAFDPQLWGYDREADFAERQLKLVTAAADAFETKRTAPRLELARFYLARDMYPEAKGVLDVALGEEKPTEDPSGLIMRAFAGVMLGRIDDAMKDLAHPVVANQSDSKVWRALAFARQGNWAEAHENFRNVEGAMAALPIELQRLLLKEAIRASVEVRDFSAAANHLHGFETLGVSKGMEPAIAVLAGRIAEGLGRSGDALVAYRTAAGSTARPAAAQGRLRETKLRYQLGDLKRSDVIADLEELTAVWRGDETEIEALQALARLYTEEARHRDAFHVMRTALMAHPNSDMTRRIHEEAASTFDALFLAGKGDAMPVIDALGLFYDFRELTPIGRRGDEMIRRLADRLVSVDLLDQAAELLQHQVDHRLKGAARAQVATRLAVIYLMNRKPDRALATLFSTQAMNLATELRHQRLLIEARALSDIGRFDLALEVIANIDAREATRLRADILWAAKRWREAAEQIELLYGERWRDWQPLAEPERADLLRAAVGYALAEDSLGLERFRERYAPKMSGSPERRAFEVATAPLAASAAEFRAVARMIAAGDTLDGFLRDMRARYPETGSFSPQQPPSGQQSSAPSFDAAPTAAIAAAAAPGPAPNAAGAHPWPPGWRVR